MIFIRKQNLSQGFHIQFANGWLISVQTGVYNYHAAQNKSSLEQDRLTDRSPNAEIAVWHRNSPMVQWANGDTVQGWVSPDRIARVMSYLVNLRDDPKAWGEGPNHIWLSINGEAESDSSTLTQESK